MEGLVEEGAEVLEAEGPEPIIDAASIAAAQRVEHYEISANGAARAFAEQLGHLEPAALLQETLEEESAADEKQCEVLYEVVRKSASRQRGTDVAAEMRRIKCPPFLSTAPAAVEGG